MLHFIQDAIVISVLNCNEVSSRFHPCFLQHNWKDSFENKHKQKIYLQDTWLVCVCIVVPILCLFWNRIGNDVLHSRKGWVQGCRQQHQHVKQLSFHYSCKKNPLHYATQHHLITELSECLKNVYRILQRVV